MIPIGDGIWRLELPDGPPRTLCTDCGISRTDDPGRCGRACQFIKPDYTSAEHRIHGRARDVASEDSDEALFGCVLEMWQARLTPARAGAQWTGITTRIAERLLETGAV
ncbi:MAG: coenzyme F420 hydrogenase/dehydrogenase beta subunit N-terminal domain-containing protein, partial [Pseudomonadota bacterium]